MFGKTKKMLGNYRDVFTNWIATTGSGMFWIILIIFAITVAFVVLLGLTIGIVIGIPASILYLAFNWAVPAFGGPTISYRTAVGLLILIPIVIRLVHGKK